MKRLWIAALLLTAVLCATLSNAALLDRLTTGLRTDLVQAEAAAGREDWDLAQRLTQEAFQRWNRLDTYLHITLRHGDMDDISYAFEEVLEFIAAQEFPEYSAANARLEKQLKLLADSEALTLKNVL